MTPKSALPPPQTPVITDETVEEFIPVPYYNARVFDERFYVPGDNYKRKFAKGLFLARTAEEEEGVRAALAAYGALVPDRWRGDDRRTPWTDHRTGFTTSNDTVKADFERLHEDH